MTKRIVTTPFDEITYKIIGCAMAVHRQLGPGLREDSYQKALGNYFSDSDLAFEAERLFEVYDDPEQHRLVGYYIPDFIVENEVIVEIKALNGMDNSHLAQIIGYLAVSMCPIGLLINVGERSLHYRRVFPPLKVTEHTINRQWLYVPDWMRDESRKT